MENFKGSGASACVVYSGGTYIPVVVRVRSAARCMDTTAPKLQLLLYYYYYIYIILYVQ